MGSEVSTPSPASGGSLLSQTFALSLGKLLASLSTLLLTAALTHLLNKEEYAAYRQALMLFNLIAPALTLGVPHALFVHLGGEGSVRQREVIEDGLFTLTLSGLISFVLALSTLGVLATHLNSPLIATLSLPLAFYALSTLARQALPPPLITLGRVKLLAVFQVLSQLGTAGLISLAAWWWSGAQATLWASAITSCVSLGVGFILVWRALRAPQIPSFLQASQRSLWAWLSARMAGLKLLLVIGVPLGLARLLGTLSKELDKYMIAERFEPEVFAVYVTGAMELPVITVVTGALSSVLLPRLTAHIKRGERGEVMRLWREIINRTSLILLPVMWGVLWLADDLVRFVFSAGYEQAAEPLKIYALMLPLRCAVYSGVLIAAGAARWVTLSALVALTLNVALNLALLELIGLNGPAWATLITNYLSTFVLWWPLCKLFEVGVSGLADWGRFGRIALTSALPLIVLTPLGWVLEAQAPLTRLCVLGGAYLAFIVALYLRSGLIKHPRELIGRSA
jgi:O-antigen/teichoic acid export membrane protein